MAPEVWPGCSPYRAARIHLAAWCRQWWHAHRNRNRKDCRG